MSSFVNRYETYGPDGSYMERTQTVNGPFYHGGRARVRAGALITAGRRPNSWGDTFDDRGRSIYTYFATEPETAVAYARATGGHLYEVEPTGEASYDSTGGGSYKTQEPLRVVRKIPPVEWDSLPAGAATVAGQ